MDIVTNTAINPFGAMTVYNIFNVQPFVCVWGEGGRQHRKIVLTILIVIGFLFVEYFYNEIVYSNFNLPLKCLVTQQCGEDFLPFFTFDQPLWPSGLRHFFKLFFKVCGIRWLYFTYNILQSY